MMRIFNNRLPKPLLVFAVAALSVSTVSAQLPTSVDIGLFPGAVPNTLEVRVLPSASFGQLMSSLTFTIRWETASGATIAGPASLVIGQNCPSGFTITPSGDGTVTSGGFNYCTFNAFGFSQLADACADQVWAANTERVIATIPFRPGGACANFTIAADGYSSSSNRNYYISLNGSARTGGIYSTNAVRAVRGDLNRDVQVNITDFSLFVNAFGGACSSCVADLNFDGSVNASDFTLFVNAYGVVCP